MRVPSLQDIPLMNSAEFVEKELDLPPLPSVDDCPLSMMSNEQLLDIVAPMASSLSTGVCPSSIEAAESLLSLKTGFSPVNDDRDGESVTLVRLEVKPDSHTSGNLPHNLRQMSYTGLDKENLAPTMPAVPRRFTYPPPPSPAFIPKIKVEMLSPSYEIFTFDAPPVKAALNTPMPKIKQEVRSPSFGNSSYNIPHSKAALGTPQQYDPVQFKHCILMKPSPLKMVHSNHKRCQDVKMVATKKIKISPIITKGRLEGKHLFTPIHCSETS
jgi:hypothetical protein